MFIYHIMILKHIVLWKLKDHAEGRSKQENAMWMKEHLEALKGKIPELVSAEVGININRSDAAFDAVLISSFRNEEDLEKYKNNPLHVKISDYCKNIGTFFF